MMQYTNNIHINNINILAHRGMWNGGDQQNSLSACKKALAAGFGIEIDVRDANGELVVAHEANDIHAYNFDAICAVLKNYPESCVAINIKSSGLQGLLETLLQKHKLRNYFTFDMAFPDLLHNVKQGIVSFTRQSEHEMHPLLYPEAKGVWLDMFDSDWLTEKVLQEHFNHGKDIAIVSPELHGREHSAFWKKLKNYLPLVSKDDGIRAYLCTDHPQEAHRFFSS